MAENDIKVKFEKVPKGPFSAEEFRVKFRAFFAVGAFIMVFLFMFVAILSETAQAAKFTEFLLGFLTASLLAVIINYYYGSSESSVQPDIKTESEPVPFSTNGKPKINMENYVGEDADKKEIP